jgi:hypothetical protein
MRPTRRTGRLNTGIAGLVLFVASTGSLMAAANGSLSGTLADPIRVGRTICFYSPKESLSFQELSLTRLAR